MISGAIPRRWDSSTSFSPSVPPMSVVSAIDHSLATVPQEPDVSRLVQQNDGEGARPLQDTRNDSRRCLRLHRSVLQSKTPTQPSWRRQPRGLRASLILKLGGVHHPRGTPIPPQKITIQSAPIPSFCVETNGVQFTTLPTRYLCGPLGNHLCPPSGSICCPSSAYRACPPRYKSQSGLERP